ncbi:MAG: hypothetical protein LAN61_08240 [Acidobacteriia bacterium]|nr:hypothetical protein [Terriglobia bacterium]
MSDEKQIPEPASGRGQAISRREFAVRAALASAASTLVPGALLATPGAQEVAVASPQEPASTPKLAPASQAEAETRTQAILSRYGERLSEAQKADVRRLSLVLQTPLDALRAYPLDNGDSPALYLKPLVEREKRPAPPAARAKTRKSGRGN